MYISNRRKSELAMLRQGKLVVDGFEFPIDEVVRSEDGVNSLKDIVFVPLNPAQFVRNELLVDTVSREL